MLCVGDVVGTSGCEFLRSRLSQFKTENKIDVCIVNGENSAVGNGMLPNSCGHIFTSGADLITGGNHSLKRREIFEYLDRADNVIRPANYGDGVWGKGMAIIDKGAYKVGVINLMGRVWLDGFADPFETAEKCIEELKKETNIIFVDFHAESTSEKKALGYFLDGKVTAKDANLLKRVIEGMDALSMPAHEAADMNGDGKINASDVNLLKKKITGGE